MNKRRLIKLTSLVLSLIVITLILAISCSKPQSSTSPGGVTTAKTSVSTASTSKTPTPVYGGTLRYGMNQDMPTIGNPATQANVTTWNILSDICLETLLLLNDKGEPVPHLATDWKWDSNNLGLTLTLQKGVKFHDGTVFDAAAVKWNLEQCMSANVSELKSVQSIDVIDANTVKLNLSRTDGMLVTNLACVRGLMMSPTAYESHGSTDKERTAWAEQNPVGTGPFKFVSWQHDVSVTFEKNPNYWQTGKPYLDKIVFTTIVDQSTLLASFKAGDLDVIFTQQPQAIQELQQSGRYNIYNGTVRFIDCLEGDSLNTSSPWSNIKIRQAAMYAVDNVAYAKTLGYGYWVPTNQYDIPGRWGYNPDVVGYPYNPTKGQQLMAEAGYASGFTTNLYGLAPMSSCLASIQNFFSVIGIKANVKIVLDAQANSMYSSGWDGMFINQFNPQPTSAFQLVRNFAATAWPTRLHSVNVPTEFSDLIAKISAATDPDTQKALVWQAQKDLTDTYAFMTYFVGEYVPIAYSMKAHGLYNNVSMHWTPWDAWLEK